MTTDDPTLADASAPELEATVAIQPVENETPETQADHGEPKSFTQEELDAVVGKRLAREQRKWEREQQQQRFADSAPQQSNAVVYPGDYNTTEDYAEALAERKAVELLDRRDAARQHAEMLGAYQDREEQARDKYDDFEQVAYNQNLPITEVMAQSIQSSDNGPDILYFLGSNPKDAARIAHLAPILQAKEIGKIEASLTSNPPVRRTSTAPAPIAPVTSRSNGSPQYDTTDPRSTKSMSTSEWIEAERMRQIKKAEAQRNR